MSTGSAREVQPDRPKDAGGMTQEFTTREDAGGPMVLDAINLYGQRQTVRTGLRVQVNNLTRSVKDRKQLYADLRAKEDALTERIEQLLPYLNPALVQQLKNKYETVPVHA
jgi:hypothetical protein